MTTKEKFENLFNSLSEKEQKTLLKSMQGSSADIPRHKHYFSRRHVKLGLISDTHIGHKKFIPDALLRAYDFFRREGADAIYHAGDILEGMSGRQGHVYELSHIGATTQLNYAAELLRESPLPIYGITGNHDGWFKDKNNAGLVVGETLEDKVDQFHFLGENEADIELAPGIIMKLFHPNDGTAYARSYKLQKLIESLEGGNKPSIIAQGHYHKAGYDFIRNVHGIDAGTLMGQSRWMRGRKIAAHVGFWLLDIYYNKHGIERLTTTFVPHYER